jgi:hypothetical protein
MTGRAVQFVVQALPLLSAGRRGRRCLVSAPRRARQPL